MLNNSKLLTAINENIDFSWKSLYSYFIFYIDYIDY